MSAVEGAGAAMPSLIELDNLHFSYNRAPFIAGLSHSFAAGEISSIVGPNGCGKSTLVRLMTQHLRPKQGTVRFDGCGIHGIAPRDFARRVSLLAQSTAAPLMEVRQLVSCGRYPHQGFASRASAEDRRIVNWALEMTGSTAFVGKSVRALSGGERQRVFLAMALAQDTDVIVLDEPTTYLDIHACLETMELVEQLNSELGKTIVMVLHDLHLALTHSHHVVVMERGQILASGSPDEVVASGAIEQAFQVSLKRFEDGDGYGGCAGGDGAGGGGSERGGQSGDAIGECGGAPNKTPGNGKSVYYNFNAAKK